MTDINIGAISEALNNKVDLSSSWGTGSSSYVSLTLGASGANYTAPEDGFFCLSKMGNANQYVQGGDAVSSTKSFAPNYNNAEVFFKFDARKGQTIQIYYDLSGTTNSFVFVKNQKTN